MASLVNDMVPYPDENSSAKVRRVARGAAGYIRDVDIPEEQWWRTMSSLLEKMVNEEIRNLKLTFYNGFMELSPEWPSSWPLLRDDDRDNDTKRFVEPPCEDSQVVDKSQTKGVGMGRRH